mmetsp:Transcript_6708/g.10192  ORF Transcript_6708/g.10192 Transcript_6708/m.10192 type:complete len:112 (-) Transcript_6708:178-513(-)
MVWCVVVIFFYKEVKSESMKEHPRKTHSTLTSIVQNTSTSIFVCKIQVLLHLYQSALLAKNTINRRYSKLLPYCIVVVREWSRMIDLLHSSFFIRHSYIHVLSTQHSALDP